MREFYRNSKRNTLRYIVFKNKTKQLPYLRLVPKNEMRFLKSKDRSKPTNTLYCSFIISPHNEYHRYQSRYKDKNGKRKRWHEFSCIDVNYTIIKNLRLITSDKNKKAKRISLLGENRRRWYRCMHSLKHVSNKKVK